MSLQSFLSKIWSEIKSLFQAIPAELQTAIHIGVVVTQNIKTFVDSPTADVLTAIIPGDIDDEINTLARRVTPIRTIMAKVGRVVVSLLVRVQVCLKIAI